MTKLDISKSIVSLIYNDEVIDESIRENLIQIFMKNKKDSLMLSLISLRELRSN